MHAVDCVKRALILIFVFFTDENIEESSPVPGQVQVIPKVSDLKLQLHLLIMELLVNLSSLYNFYTEG